MFLQTLFALYSLCLAAVTASTTPSTHVNHPVLNHRTAVVQRSRHFTAKIFSPRRPSFDSRYPGAIIIATDETRDRAFLVARRLSEIGITVMMYVQADSVPRSYLVSDARFAVDSMRRRFDVRPGEVGVLAFEGATAVVPDLVHDTTLGFAVAASSAEPTRSFISRYADAHTATLLVRGVNTLKDSAAIVRALGLDSPLRADTAAADGVRETTSPTSVVAPNVTVWPVPRDQLKGIGEVNSPLNTRMMGWVRDQVHIDATVSEESSLSTR